MKKNKRHRGIYMLTAACLLIGAIGGVAAYENRPGQKVPDLQLTVGQSGYDLMAGITYDSERYTLSVEDTGGLDINRIGKYEVTYVLTPLEVPSTEMIPEATEEPSTEMIPETTEEPSTEVIPDTTEVPSTETVPGQTPDQTEPPSTETAPDASGTPPTETKPETSPDQTGTPDTGTAPDKTDVPAAGTTSGTAPDKADTPASGTVTNDPLGGELEEAQPEDNSGASAKPTDISAVAESIFGTVSAAEITDTQTEGVTYLTRTVWVVAGTDSIFIGYEEEDVKIKANEALYELVLIEDDTEQATETEPQYELVLKKPELLTEGIRVTDSAASLYNGASVTVTDDSELKNAVNIETAEDGTKTIKDINFGTYTIEVTAEDQSTGKKASCTRTVTVEAEGIRFDAPPLCIGTQDIDYDLTTDVTAVDEYDNPVEEIYVVDDSELQAAKETVVDEESGDELEQYRLGNYLIKLGAKDPVTGKEYLTDREVQVTNGFYLYAPPIEIEVGSTNYDILDGLQLRSIDEAVEGDETTGSDEAVEAASTFAGDEIADSQLEFSIGDLSKKMLETYSMNDEELLDYIEEMEEREIETDAAKEALSLAADEAEISDSLPLKEGVYPIEVQAVDKTSGETYTGTRMVIVRSVQNNDAMAYQVKAYAEAVQDQYKDGDIYRLAEKTRLVYPEVYKGGTYAGVPVPAPSLDMYNYVGMSFDKRICYQYKFGKNIKNNSLAAGAGLQGGYEIYTSHTGTNGNPQYYYGIFPREKMSNGTLYNGQWLNFGGDSEYQITLIKNNPYTGYYYVNPFAANLPSYVRSDAYIDSVGNWNNFLGKARDLPTMKEGGDPDVLVTANKPLIQDNLNFERLEESIQNITPESSIQIDLKGKVLNGNNSEQAMPAMQVSIENAMLSTNDTANRMSYKVPKDGWIRLKGFTTTDALMANTEQNLKNRQMYINLSGAGTVVFDGGDDATKADKLYGIVENTSGDAVDVVLQTNQGAANIDTPKKFSVNSEAATYNFTVNVAQGTSIDAFNLYNIFNGSQKPANRILLGGDGTLRFNRDVNIIDATNLYSQAYAKKIELENQITVLKSGKDPVGETAEQLPALRVSGIFVANGKKVVAGVNKDNQEAPAENEVFAISDSNVLDPTDFTVKTDTTDGTWGSDGSWFMANAGAANKQIVFMKNEEIAKTPIKVEHGSTEKMFATYKEALNYIETQADTVYTVTNLRPMDFTAEDLEALKSMTGTRKSITFTGAATGAGAVTYGDRYHVRFRGSFIEMPAGYDITWDQPVKYDEGVQTGATVSSDNLIEFVNNGSTLTFETHYMAVDIIRENADVAGNYVTLETVVDIYGGAAAGTCSVKSGIVIKTGKFRSVYGGNKAGSHTGNVDITIDNTTGKVQVTLLDGASVGETAKPAGRTATITTTGNVRIPNLYNYDKLTIKSGTLTISSDNAAETNIDSQKASGYVGETILHGGTKVALENSSGTRRMGSLKLEQAATNDATFEFAKASGTTSATDNQHLVRLTAEQPLTGTNATNKIEVKYSGTTNPVYNDIVFHLPNAKNNPANVTTQYLKDGFGGRDADGKIIKMMPSVGNNTVVLRNASVGLSVSTDLNNITPFMTLKDALEDANNGIRAKEQQTQGQSYRITFFGDGYSISDEDIAALKDTGIATAGDITWTSKIDMTSQQKPETLTTANTVYLSGNISLFGKTNKFEDIKLSSGGEASIFAEGKPLTIGTGVEVSGTGATDLYGGSNVKQTSVSTLVITSSGGKGFSTIYGGGKQAQNGNATITMSGGKVGTIYGGGNGAAGKLTGNTTITVSDSGRVTDSIYGGGKGAQVTGNTTINCSGNNTTGEAKAVMKKISGSGTDDTGNATDNVGGTKTISIETTGNQHTGTLVLDELTGFDALNLTNKGGEEIEKAILYVKQRFDSSATGTGSRTGTVKLSAVGLVLDGTEPGHIGSLDVEKTSLLVIPRDAGGTTSIPLKIDKTATTFETGVQLKLGILKTEGQTTKMSNTPGDKVITFTNGVTDTKEHEKYIDALQTSLPVSQQNDGTKTHIKFDMPKTHLATGWAEYSADPAKPDTADVKAAEKTIHVVYDKSNEHAVKGGYIAVMPKNKVGTADETNYTVTDKDYIEQTKTADYIKLLTFTKTGTENEATGEVVLSGLDTENNWYILHTLCEQNDASVLLLDLDAPVEGDPVDVQLNETGDSYIYELHLHDPEPKANETLPSTEVLGSKVQLPYNANGIKAAYYKIDDLAGSGLTEADKEAVKQKDSVNLATGTHGLKKAHVSLLIGDGAEEVQGTADAKITVTIPKTEIGDGKGKALYVYAKDGLNNTVRVKVLLNENIIDVSVPLQVNVIAVKKPAGGDRELLAPVCEVKNNGQQMVDAQIVGFENRNTQKAQLDFSNKEKGSNFNANEIALFLKGADATVFTETNVLDITVQAPIQLGTLNAAGSAGSAAKYTFDAGYNVTDINIPDGYVTGYLSYHFKVKK